MNAFKILIAVFATMDVATLAKWLYDGRNILTKQQMAFESQVKDEVFGTTIMKTEFVSGFWLGLDIAVPIFVATSIGIGFCIWRMRKA